MRHPARLDSPTLLTQCKFSTTRRGGPGGQHRNKVETAVVLQHQPTGITAQAAERRSQAENRRLALFRLRVNLALAVRCPMPSPFAPSESWHSRCRGGQMSINPQHEDFPALLAEALDVLAACDFDALRAAGLLECTPTQLVKLLKLEARALDDVNQQRRARHMHPLR
jgi:hypothetical protein